MNTPNTEPTPVLTATNLSIAFAGTTVVDNISFDLRPGECLALVGESGSGKSVTARALLGLTGGTVTADTLTVLGHDATTLDDAAWRSIRGTGVAMVLQDALTALDPLRPIHREIGDVLRLHPPRKNHISRMSRWSSWSSLSSLSSRGRRNQAVQMLAEVGMPEPELRATQRSPQLSGGMRQRALIAQALIGDPQVVIADEATTALDTQLTALVLSQLRRIKESGRAVLMISHDLAQVAEVADRIAVMRAGRIVEHGPARHLLTHPTHEYTRTLLRAIPTGVPRFHPLSDDAAASPAKPALPAPPTHPAHSAAPALRVTGLTRRFGHLTAVDNVSFTLPAGTTLGVVGESGSGKTTTARMVLGLTRPDAGSVELQGHPFAPARESSRRHLRTQLGAIYQDPLGSFDPRYSVRALLTNALSAGRTTSARSYREPAAALLEHVALSPDLLERHPRELSGGQRQRLAIARALAPQPAVLVLDEPVSALDVSIQATVLDLLDHIQRTTGTSYLFISHDLSVIQHMSDTVAVMQAGRLVELGPTQQVFSQPEHPYTQQLLDAAPRLPQ